jgi:hypothetical protein
VAAVRVVAAEVVAAEAAVLHADNSLTARNQKSKADIITGIRLLI